MKRLWVVSLSLLCLLAAGCNFSKGAKKNFSTGLSFSYSGFRVQDVLLIDPSDKPMTDNKVQLNSKMAIVALGLSSYGEKDGRVYPGMMLSVTDKNGTPVISAADLFDGDQGHPPAAASELRGDISIGQPMVSGQTYHVKVHIWDKVKAGNEVNAEADLVVQ